VTLQYISCFQVPFSKMSQSNTFKILQNILSKAVKNGNPQQSTGAVLLEAMQLELKPSNLIYFFEILANAKEELNKLESDDNFLFISTIEKLQTIFTENSLWTQALLWSNCHSLIDSQHFITILSLLADKANFHNPEFALEQGFLDDLKRYLESLIVEVDGSELSNKLKKYINRKIRDILREIDRYNITGSEAIRKTTISVVSEFNLIENSFSDQEKKSPTVKKVKSTLAAMFISFIKPDIYDLIGLAPTIQQYSKPLIETLINSNNQLIDNNSYDFTLQELINNTVNNLKEEPTKFLSGRELKALPASREDSETEKENDTSEDNLE